LPNKNYKVGDDVTHDMGIVQYCATQDRDPIQKSMKQSKNPALRFLFRFSIFRKLFMKNNDRRKQFPDFISKSDETRCQNLPFLFQNRETKYVVTEKLDGCSATFSLKRIGKNKFDFAVCSRNLRLFDDDGGIYWQVAKKYDIRAKLEKLILAKDNFVAIQGEILAPKIQGNKYKVTEPEFYAFNLIYPEGRMGSVIGRDILSLYKIPWVPILETEFTLPETVLELLEYADGKSVVYDTMREGVVLRNNKKGISFKAVSPKFLMKNDE
jgi:RNA ligase (TIGR02306 family)